MTAIIMMMSKFTDDAILWEKLPEKKARGKEEKLRNIFHCINAKFLLSMLILHEATGNLANEKIVS